MIKCTVTCVTRDKNDRIIGIGILSDGKTLPIDIKQLKKNIDAGWNYETVGGAKVLVNKQDEVYSIKDGKTFNNLGELKECPCPTCSK